jgi:endonuclease/exonuclease/phosphatase family metal-dependent hydrolase
MPAAPSRVYASGVLVTAQRSRFRWPAWFSRGIPALGIGLVLGSCAPAINLLNPAGPRFEGRYASESPPATSPDSSIRVVTFNVRFAREIDRAIEVLRDDSLRGADILALQEMDETAVERIARTLGYDYAFYPAVIHPTSGRYFGPAVLSRWPIERSWKVLLPHAGRTRGQRRTASAAILRVGNTRIRAYAVHLETPASISGGGHRDQALAVLADAAEWRGPVVIAGDFNSEGIGLLFERQGYVWLTKWVGPTVSWFSWDHVLVRGLAPARPRSAGVVRDVRGASDHRPVWAVALTTGAAAPTRPSPRAAR